MNEEKYEEFHLVAKEQAAAVGGGKASERARKMINGGH